MRLRLRFTTWPRPAIELTDTPRPNCPTCQGQGGWAEDYGHPETGEYDGTEDIVCDCWNPENARLVTPVPRWAARRWLGWVEPQFSEEPPF